MSDLADPGVRPGQGPAPVMLSLRDVADILADLPGGQSVSAATRRLYQQLHDARQRGAALLPAPRGSVENGVIRSAPRPVRDAPEEHPRRFWIICKQDISEITGIGVIAEGCHFSDGAVVWRDLWTSGWGFSDRLDVVPYLQVHQRGSYELVWIDTDDDDEPD